VEITVLADQDLVRIRGPVDDVAAPRLREALGLAARRCDDRAVVVDLGQVTDLGPEGIEELARPALEGYSVTLVGVSPSIAEALGDAGVAAYITIEPA
jgi:anti-anti-sigma regulatory factor